MKKERRNSKTVRAKTKEYLYLHAKRQCRERFGFDLTIQEHSDMLEEATFIWSESNTRKIYIKQIQNHVVVFVYQKGLGVNTVMTCDMFAERHPWFNINDYM